MHKTLQMFTWKNCTQILPTKSCTIRSWIFVHRWNLSEDQWNSELSPMFYHVESSTSKCVSKTNDAVFWKEMDRLFDFLANGLVTFSFLHLFATTQCLAWAVLSHSTWCMDESQMWQGHCFITSWNPIQGNFTWTRFEFAIKMVKSSWIFQNFDR